MDSDSDQGPSTPKKKRLRRGDASKSDKPKKRKQKYRSEWEHCKEFKRWLTNVKNDEYHAYCKWCKVPMVADTSVFKNHVLTKKHKKYENSVTRESQKKMENFAEAKADENNAHKTNVRRAEIKLTGSFAAHNIPFRYMDHLLPCLQSAFPDSKILKDVVMKRNKTTLITKNVIADTEKINLAEVNKKALFKYSLIFVGRWSVGFCFLRRLKLIST